MNNSSFAEYTDKSLHDWSAIIREEMMNSDIIPEPFDSDSDGVSWADMW